MSNLRVALALLGATVLSLTGCPAASDRASDRAPAASEPCTKLGQTCTFSPGKLGTCVQRDECDAGSCFVCQSQH